MTKALPIPAGPSYVLIDALADVSELTAGERKELLPSGGQQVFDNCDDVNYLGHFHLRR
ncbi:MAG: hypothetical protein PF636_00205 [Actinomycetota bacterium]|jgi:hypothetical protein|nr:hypothetical protein [Actinomycetota bacterium]